MNISKTLFINLRKLRHGVGKAMFLILPVGVLMAMTVVISSQAANFQQAASQSILGTAALANTVLRIDIPPQTFTFGKPLEQEAQEYTQTDLTTINNIPSVQSAQLASRLPLGNSQISGLFEDIELQIGDVIGLLPEMAGLYTEENFGYSAGEAIPVILNASTFINNYEDWGGKNKITIEMPRPTQGQPVVRNETEIKNQTPIKSEAITYDESSLIGKEITLTVGSLDPLLTYTTDFGENGITFSKKTTKSINKDFKNRKDAINKYWKYDQLTKPLTYKLKVVGVIESDSDFSTYIPTEAANQVMRDYFKREIEARRQEVPKAQLNAIYNGISYDGYQLTSDTFGQIMRNARFGARGQAVFRMGASAGSVKVEGAAPGPVLDRVEVNFADNDSYNIPGLVIETNPDTDAVKGQYAEPRVYEKAVKSAATMWVKIADVSDRDEVVADINEAGYSYQDFNNLEVFGSIDQSLQSVTLGLAIAFIGLSIGVVILTMSKFVSDSRKEIGIFRAMGMTKNGIRLLFISQALIYTSVGYLIGLGIGALINFGSAGAMFAWFNQTVTSALDEGFEIVQSVNAGLFQQLSWEPIAVYSLLLLGVTLVISLIPANRAAAVSPVEAIREG